MEILLYFIFGLSGACAASFAGCLAAQKYRRSFKARSCCDNCGHMLAWYDLIPVFSYLILKGKCRYCGCKISPVHLLTEGASALYCIMLYRHFQMTVRLAEMMLLMTVMLFAALYDLYAMEIPDICIVLAGLIMPVFERPDWQLLKSRLASAAFTALYICILSVLFYLFRKQNGIGFGDIKLFFVCGLYLSFQMELMLVSLSGMIGAAAVFVSGKKKIPFGPCITAAFLILILYV